MRRTSSLGRRSSTQSCQPQRLVFGSGDSAKRDDKGKKKSMLLQPGFSRASSADRLSFNTTNENVPVKRSTSVNVHGTLKKQAPNSMRRSSSHNNLVLKTPSTPGYTLNENLLTGVYRPDRSQMMSTDSTRMSGVGGTKLVRKDTRPLNDKAYINEAIARIKYFFQTTPECYPKSGDSINLSPMTTTLFVDMVEVLTNILGVRVSITRSNYAEELPGLMKKLRYRGKTERSWLITVNAPHSFQYVIGLLEWLVIVVQCYKCVDIESLMYPEILIPEDCEDDNILNFKILNPFLKWYYNNQFNKNCTEEAVLAQDERLLHELKLEAQVEDLEHLESVYNNLANEVNNPSAEEEEEMYIIQDFKNRIDVLSSDKQSNNEFIQRSKNYIEDAQQQITVMEEREEVLQKTLERKSTELQKLRSQVESQELQLIDKEQLDGERLSLQRDIQTSQDSYSTIEDLVYKEDLLLVAARMKVDKAVGDFNKVITENRAYEPRLKSAELDRNVLNKDAEEKRQNIDKFLKDFKSEYKAEYENIESEEEETARALIQAQEKLSALLDDKNKIQSEKITLEENFGQFKKTVQLKRKEKLDEITNLQNIKKDVTSQNPQVEVESIEKKKAILNDIESDIAIVKDEHKNYFNKCKEFVKNNKLAQKKEEEKLLARLKSIQSLFQKNE